MKHLTGKIAAVVSSVALLGAYVAYQAGALHLPGGKAGAAQPAAGATTSPATQATGTTQPAPALMGGSKSRAVVVPGPAADRMLFYGSKSMGRPAPAPPGAELTLTPATAQPPATQSATTRRVLFSGSKSFQLVEPSAVRYESTSNPFTLNPPATRPSAAPAQQQANPKP